MICPRCKSTIPDGSSRCPECHYDLSGAMTDRTNDYDINNMDVSIGGYEKEHPVTGDDGPDGNDGRGSGRGPSGPVDPRREEHGKNGLAAVIVVLVIAAVIVMLVASAHGCDAGSLGEQPSNDTNTQSTQSVTNDNVTPGNTANDNVAPQPKNDSSSENENGNSGYNNNVNGSGNENSSTNDNASDNGARNGNATKPADEAEESGLVGTWRGTLTKCSGGCYASQLPEYATTLTINSYDPTTGKVKLTLSRCDHNHDKLDNDADSTPGDSLVTADYTATMDDGFFKLDKLPVGGEVEFWTYAYVEVHVANADSPFPSMTLTYSSQKDGGYSTYDEFTMTKES